MPESEVDYLNGEVVLLGKLHGIPTPWNAVVRRIASARMRQPSGVPPVSLEELQKLVGSEPGPAGGST
jgi:2-dehydropantoate 2-reductase